MNPLLNNRDVKLMALRLAFICIVLVIILHSQLVYASSMKLPDLILLLTTLASLAGFDLRAIATTPKAE